MPNKMEIVHRTETGAANKMEKLRALQAKKQGIFKKIIDLPTDVSAAWIGIIMQHDLEAGLALAKKHLTLEFGLGAATSPVVLSRYPTFHSHLEERFGQRNAAEKNQATKSTHINHGQRFIDDLMEFGRLVRVRYPKQNPYTAMRDMLNATVHALNPVERRLALVVTNYLRAKKMMG